MAMRGQASGASRDAFFVKLSKESRSMACVLGSFVIRCARCRLIMRKFSSLSLYSVLYEFSGFFSGIASQQSAITPMVYPRPPES